MDYESALNSLPEHMRPAMREWIERGRMPGPFLKAILCNDFVHAVLRADEVNLGQLRAYALFLMNDAPSECFGSLELVERWKKGGGLLGIEARQRGDVEIERRVVA